MTTVTRSAASTATSRSASRIIIVRPAARWSCCISTMRHAGPPHRMIQPRRSSGGIWAETHSLGHRRFVALAAADRRTRHLGGAARFGGEYRLPGHCWPVRAADSDDPVDRGQLRPDPDVPDADLRAPRRHAGLSPRVPARHRLEHAGVPRLRAGPVIPAAAGRAGGTRCRRRAYSQLRAGARHQPVPRGSARPRAGPVYDDVRHRRGAGSGGVRLTGAVVGLVGGVQCPRPHRSGGISAGLDAARG